DEQAPGRVVIRRGVLALLLLSGCAAEEPRARIPLAEAPASPERTFGAPPDVERPLTPLASILAEPERYRDQVVRTEGEIAQVCQRMGCWMELRESPQGPAVRVPMAGHRFFLPRDVVGRRAMLEGRVAMRVLSAAERAHYESEGATATDPAPAT